ncbi:uncharacterized protein LOC142329917 isoform X1 [Lycorma delicatula]|uniref:uncharacterized protein LOC142329917 isoform X1 n=1 Tax=Lycorma delicatula TaxID=130591 RepID=UPI003F51103D
MFECDPDFDIDEESLEVIENRELSKSNTPAIVEYVTPARADINQKHDSRPTLPNLNPNQGVQANHKTGTTQVFCKHVQKGNSTSVEKKIPAFANRPVQRKFPGPAGLLPDRIDAISNADLCDSPKITSLHNNSISYKEVCNFQNWQSLLESASWKKLLVDLKSVSRDIDILECINIKNIKQKASAKLLLGCKVPFLIAVLCDINSSSPDPYITLCDQTDEINGTLHKDVWKQLGDKLVSGCVLLLRNVAVLSLGINPRKNQHYLNITPHNLASLYYSEEGEIKVTNIKPTTHDDIVKFIKDWHLITAPTTITQQFEEKERQLFSSLLSTPLDISSDNSFMTPEGSVPLVTDNSCNSQRSTPLSSKNNVGKENCCNFLQPSQNISHLERPIFYPKSRMESSCKIVRSKTCGSSSPSMKDSSAVLNLLPCDNHSPILKASQPEKEINIKDFCRNTNTYDFNSNSINCMFTSKKHENTCTDVNFNKRYFSEKNNPCKNISRFVPKSPRFSKILNQNIVSLNSVTNENISENEKQSTHTENRLFCSSFNVKKPRLEPHESIQVKQNTNACNVLKDSMVISNKTVSNDIKNEMEEWSINSVLESSFFEEDF